MTDKKIALCEKCQGQKKRQFVISEVGSALSRQAVLPQETGNGRQVDTGKSRRAGNLLFFRLDNQPDPPKVAEFLVTY